MNNICYLVVPCYNESSILPTTANILKAKYDNLVNSKLISPDSKILLIDNGSDDSTWETILDIKSKNPYFSALKLRNNFGYPKGVLAGLLTIKDKCDFAISLDADLQDDISVIDNFIMKYNDGNHVVYGVRNSRAKDTWFKRNTAILFYKIMSFLGTKNVYNHAEFRLMSKEVLQTLSDFPEANLSLRGIIPLFGFKADIVYYERKERLIGKSKFPLFKLISFAIDELTSVTIVPIRLVSVLGIFISFTSFTIFAMYMIFKFLDIIPVMGYTSIICSIWLIGGLQLLSIGVIGEYIGKTYIETKHRPRYIIEKFLE